jgi:hypothetical protein
LSGVECSAFFYWNYIIKVALINQIAHWPMFETTKTLRMKYLVLLFTISISSICAVRIRVSVGGSIQDAVNLAAPGDTIIVEPGTYRNVDSNAMYGVHITKNNIRLVGERSGTKKVVVQYLPGSEQQVGIFFGPPGCEYNTPGTQAECNGNTILNSMFISGIVVEGFPRNGIQTRRVDKFKILKCESVRNLGNGIYPTLSTNGLLQDNVAFGSKDSAMWPSGCENVTMIGNTLRDSVLGLEITVSNRIWARNNIIYNNTVGVSLAHPNNTRTPMRPVMKDWFIEDNDIYDNNRENDSPPGALQENIPKGFGVLILGVSDHVVRKNKIRDNGTAGIAVVGYCTGQALADPNRACSEQFPPRADPSANNNLISQNNFKRNGGDQDPLIKDLGIPGTDILYIQSPSLNETGDGNCFELKNRDTAFAIVDFEPSTLPDGCKNN